MLPTSSVDIVLIDRIESFLVDVAHGTHDSIAVTVVNGSIVPCSSVSSVSASVGLVVVFFLR